MQQFTGTVGFGLRLDVDVDPIVDTIGSERSDRGGFVRQRGPRRRAS
jgi:hypothetical protein